MDDHNSCRPVSRRDGTGRGTNQLAIVPGFRHHNILTAPALAALASLATAFPDAVR
jgi:hypothetical protein